MAPWAAALLVAALLVYVSTYIRRYYGGRLALDVQHDLRTEMYGTITRLDGRRQDELSTGQVVGRATSDLQLIQGLLFMLPMTIGNVLLFVISLAIMAWLSLPLTLIALAVAPALGFIARRSRSKLHPSTWYAQAQAAAVAGVVDGAVSGVRVVKGFGQEDQETGKLREVGHAAVRGPPPHDPAERPLHPRPPGRPRPRPGRDARAGRLARGARAHHARHVRRVLHLPRPTRRPGPHAGHGPHGRPAGPRQYRTCPGAHRHRALHDERHQGTPRRRPGHSRVRRRVVRLRPRAPGPERPQLRDPPRRDPRGRRLLRLRKIHGLALAAPLLRRHPRRRPHRRPRRPRTHPRLAARRDRPGPRGLLPLLRHDPQQHRLRPPRRDRGGDPHRLPRRAGRPVHRGTPRRLRHDGRGARPHPLRRPAPARRPRPRDPHRPAFAGPGRRDLGGGRPSRARDPRGVETGHAGPHHPAHRAPPLHPQPRRPHRRPRRGPPRRHRHARRTPGALTPLPPPPHRPRRTRRRLTGPRPARRTGRRHLRTGRVGRGVRRRARAHAPAVDR